MILKYRDKQAILPTNLIGGTPEAPALRGSDQLLLDWAYERMEDDKVINIFGDPEGLLAAFVPGEPARIMERIVPAGEKVNEPEANVEAPPVFSVLDDWPPARLNLMPLPKSLELFDFMLSLIARRATSETSLAVSFMTRHFSPRLLEIAGQYATSVQQSRAYKKARILELSNWSSAAGAVQPVPALASSGSGKARPAATPLTYQSFEYHQYPGVFSGKHIDYATQFLLDTWSTEPALLELPTPQRILDLCCGNGVIGHQLMLRYPEAELAAFDASLLAVASAQENFQRLLPARTWRVFAAAEMPEEGGPWDLAVINPPFHQGYRNSIDVALHYFSAMAARLTPNGHLIVVANRHLGYGSHLRKSYQRVEVVMEKGKYVIFKCGVGEGM